MTLKTLQEKIEWYSIMHKQNLNGRETEDELFEKGIEVGITETEEMKDDYAIEFAKWTHKLKNCEKDTDEYNLFFNTSDKELRTYPFNGTKIDVKPYK